MTTNQSLSRQCKEILDLLQRGPATNVQLNAIAFRYSPRIAELRRAGYRIEITERGKNGLNTYALIGDTYTPCPRCKAQPTEDDGANMGMMGIGCQNCVDLDDWIGGYVDTYKIPGTLEEAFEDTWEEAVTFYKEMNDNG